MRKTLTDKCAETGQIKDWLETAVICFTGNEKSNVNCTCRFV